jgi:hypothetical protein
MKPASGRNPANDCARIKDLGYSTSRHIHMYGEEFEIISDPFPDGDGVAVEAITSRDPAPRRLRLPVAILVGLRDRCPTAA